MEVIDLINEILDEEYQEGGLAWDIMDIIEEAGMLPPARMIDGKYPEYMVDQYSWEKE